MNIDQLLTLIIPCYNEADHLRLSFLEIERAMALTSLDWELIFVDDCSSDTTRDVIIELESGRPNIRHVFHEKNLGRGGAVKTGFAAAKGAIGGFLDIDLEVHCRYIPSMVQAVMAGADIVCGYRLYKVPVTFDDIFRDVLSVGYRNLVRILLKIKVHDTEAGYKFFNMKTIRPIMELTRSDDWFFDTEIMALAAYRGCRIAEVPMVYIRRDDKKTTVKPVKASWDSLMALLAFRRRFKRSFIYRSPKMYHFFLNLLYKGRYDDRFEAVSENIPDGATVLDACCGTARLFQKYLAPRGIKYTGLDINPSFIGAGRAGGIDIRPFDIQTRAELPSADIVIMLSSLYHFIPEQGRVLEKMASAARKTIIITEPVRNISSLANPIMRKVGEASTNPGTGPAVKRFDSESLENALAKYNIIKRQSLCEGREMLYVIDVSENSSASGGSARN